MISKLEISGIHGEAGERLQKYVSKKIGKLERYVPRHARKSSHFEVKLREQPGSGGHNFNAEFILHVPHAVLTAKEATVNMYAAVDIVEARLKSQLKKYKESHASPSAKRRLYAKLRPMIYS